LDSAHDFGDVWLWIDQICIDQKTVKERNWQVSLMSKIYARASKVLIWLGTEADGSAEGIEAINSGYAAVAQHGQQVQALFERPYWNRLWIIQEVLMSQAALVMCGDQAFDLRQLARMYIPNADDTSRSRAGYPVLIAFSVLALIKYASSSGEFERKPLSSILSSFATSQCEDPRDKVYGLLSLVRSPELIAVDYSKTPARVFFDAIYHIVRDEVCQDFDDQFEIALCLRDCMGLRTKKAVIEMRIDDERINIRKGDHTEHTDVMLRAIRRDDTSTMQMLLDTRPDCVNQKDKHGRTLLMQATRHNKKGAVQLLLNYGKAEVETQDMDGLTPLLCATTIGDLDLVKLLLTVGKANIEAKSTSGWTCLMLAVSEGNESMVKLLLSVGKPDLGARDKIGQTPLMQAMERGEDSIIKLLLCVGDIDADARDEMPKWRFDVRAHMENTSDMDKESTLDMDTVDINATDS
jgi:ankyrin repeat protein